MFADVSQEWKKILLKGSLKDDLKNIRNQIKEMTPDDKMCPPKQQWFEFARLTELENVKVIIVGQDPYHTPGDAHGLSFSSLNKKMPASLRNIFTCLKKSGLIDEIPNHSDLTSWAKQGVLLINAALSTEQGIAGKHLRLWTLYSINIIKNLSNYGVKNNKKYIFLLWGNFAQNFKNFINPSDDNPNHIIMNWVHPSPMAQSRISDDKKFINCDHFIKTNQLLETFGDKPINWNSVNSNNISKILNKSKIIHKVFTDGSCLGNGKATAVGGYAAIFVDGPWKDQEICDKLQNTTNIRAEGTAIIKVLELLDNDSKTEWDSCEIYTDSDFWLKMLTVYMPKWKESNFDLKANPDLTKHIWKLWNKLKLSGKDLKIIWVPAHNRLGTRNSTNEYERWCYINNDMVDKLATSMTNN